jgi:hypothetical protein
VDLEDTEVALPVEQARVEEARVEEARVEEARVEELRDFASHWTSAGLWGHGQPRSPSALALR